MAIGFQVVKRFSHLHPGWSNYVEFAGLSHITEGVGMDCMLNGTVLDTLINEDWDHLLFADELYRCFDSAEYLMHRLHNTFDHEEHQLLALEREPTNAGTRLVELPEFEFLGFDLIDEATGISSLTNCGGFEGAFKNSDLSEVGLVRTAESAYKIKQTLRVRFPNEPHADCHVWAIARCTDPTVYR